MPESLPPGSGHERIRFTSDQNRHARFATRPECLKVAFHMPAAD